VRIVPRTQPYVSTTVLSLPLANIVLSQANRYPRFGKQAVGAGGGRHWTLVYGSEDMADLMLRFVEEMCTLY
jgi:hypothetical protein